MPATLIRPPLIDPSKSAIENVLELTTLSDIGPDIFTNTRPLWHPPAARGIYGGAAIAQSLAAAQLTIPPPSAANKNAVFLIHSMHCYFVLAGDAEIPILYHVERVREGNSFMTRTVQARQRGKCIFTTTMSFVREGSGGVKRVEHGWGMENKARKELDDILQVEERRSRDDAEAAGYGAEEEGPFVSKGLPITNHKSSKIHTKRTRQWIRAKGTISPAGGHQAHLSALAYMSDSYFIGTVSRVHNLWRFGIPKKRQVTSDISQNTGEKEDTSKPHPLAHFEEVENREAGDRPEIGMMVSLDHTIYFHRPRDVRVDEWIYTENESPWAGDGRGLVTQRMWSQDGKLIASCFQEGLVRLKQDDNSGRKSKL